MSTATRDVLAYGLAVQVFRVRGELELEVSGKPDDVAEWWTAFWRRWRPEAYNTTKDYDETFGEGTDSPMRTIRVSRSKTAD